MSTHSFCSRRPWKVGRLSFSLLAGLFMALLLALSPFSGVSAASAQHTLDTPPAQNVARAGVSVVRLVASYTTGAGKVGQQPVVVQCTGLGILVASWPQQGNDPNTWILTDGSLVNGSVTKNAGAVTCGNLNTTGTLSSLQILLSTSYNPNAAAAPIPLDTDLENRIFCQITSDCSKGAALLAVNVNTLFPYVDLSPATSVPATSTPVASASATGTPVASASATSTPATSTSALSTPTSTSATNTKGNVQPMSTALGLTQNATSSDVPTPDNNNAQHNPDYLKQAETYLTPHLLAVNNANIESGTPLVDANGSLVSMRLNSNSTLTPADIRSFMQAQPALQSIPQNIVYDSWKTGITAFYQRQYAQAYSAFQQASKTNPQFQGAILFAQLAQQNASNTSAHSTSVGGFKLHNVLLPYWLLSIVGLIFLALLLLIITLLFGRSYQERRRFKRDLDEARRRAAIEAPRLKEQEISQRDALSQQPTLLPIEPSATAFAPVAPTPTPAPVPSPATPRSGPLTMEQLCPRCNEPVAPGSRFCGNCRLPLPGAAANKRQSGLLSVFSAQPMDSIVNQPTLDMSSSIPPTNGTVDPEETEPQLKPTLPHKYPGLLVVTRTNPGIKRQYKPNEDNLFAGKVLREVNGDLVPCALLVVADGMGGHANGQDASRIAIQTIIDYMLPRLLKGGELSSEDYKQLMLDGVQRANQAVHQGNVDSHGDMGTTMTGSLIVGTTAYVANVGDSRTYLYRQSDGLSKVTQDHSVVASLVSAGIIKPDDIYTHPKRNQIYRSLGERENVEIDPFVVQLQPDDKLLLCSDGLWDMVRDPLIEGVIKQNSSDLDKTADGLIKAALAGGGEDNVSVIVAHIAEAAPSPGKPGFQLVYKPDSVPLPDF